MRQIKLRCWNEERKLMFIPLPSYEKGEVNINTMIQDFADHNVMMQFTGAQDDNGVDIYEGDILECVSPELHKENDGLKIARFIQDYDYGFQLVSPEDRVGLPIGWFEKKKIVGNIYQNPTLVDVKSNELE